MSLAPSMLPRPPWVQAVESLVLAATGWSLGRRGPRCPAWSAVALVVVLLAEPAWQALLWLRAGAGLPGALVPLTLLVAGAGVLLLRGTPSPRGVARLGVEVVAGVLAVELVVASLPSTAVEGVREVEAAEVSGELVEVVQGSTSSRSPSRAASSVRSSGVCCEALPVNAAAIVGIRRATVWSSTSLLAWLSASTLPGASSLR